VGIQGHAGTQSGWNQFAGNSVSCISEGYLQRDLAACFQQSLGAKDLQPEVRDVEQGPLHPNYLT
jgi:hypothetical protein